MAITEQVIKEQPSQQDPLELRINTFLDHLVARQIPEHVVVGWARQLIDVPENNPKKDNKEMFTFLTTCMIKYGWNYHPQESGCSYYSSSISK